MQDSESLISVVIPVYNGESFLAEAIESVRLQRSGPVEIIVIDDGSTDRSYEVARGFSQVRAFRQSNSGAAAARNVGIREAQGEFLAFLDADDLWAPGKLALQLELLERDRDVQIVAGRVEEFYSQPPAQQTARLLRRSGDRAYTVGALLMRRNDFLDVGMFTESLRFGEFLDWRSRAIAMGKKEYVPDAVVLRRRIHDHNTTRAASKADYMMAIKAHLERKRSST